jgi:hypothetical protein
MVSNKTRLPLVSIYWPTSQDAAQMTPDEARQFALSILQAAEAAEQDAFIMDFATKKMGLDDGHGAALVNEFRVYRGQERGPEEAGPCSD